MKQKKHNGQEYIDTIKYHTWFKTPYGKDTKNTRKHHTKESKYFSYFLVGGDKAARNRQGSIIFRRVKHNNRKGK